MNRRTPEQILRVKQQEIDNLNALIANKKAKNDPRYLPIQHALDTLKKQETVARKVTGSSKQSADARIKKHLRWIDKIEAERAEASNIITAVKALRKQLNALRNSFTSKEKKPTTKAVVDAVDKIINPKPDKAESESQNA
jgi:ribosomal protein L19E